MPEAQTQDPSGVREPPRRFGATLRQLGPGIIVAGSIVGSGELIATTKVGAEAGFWLLWLVVVGCLIKVFTQVELGRYTITWGETTLQALDRVPGPRWRVNWLVWYWAFMTLLVVSQQGGILGGVGQALAIAQPLTEEGAAYQAAQDAFTKARVEQSLAEQQGATAERLAALAQEVEALGAQAAVLAEPIDAVLWAGLVALLTVALLVIGRYGLIQSVSTVLVASFTALTVVTLFALQTTDFAVRADEFVRGLQFRLPPPGADAGINPVATALAAFGIIGLGAGELIMYPYWCLEKGYAQATGPREETAAWRTRAKGWLRVLQTDAWLSLAVYTFATVVFYLLGATVLGRVGLNPAGGTMVRTLAEMYVPVFGPWASGVFLVGAIAVLYSTFFVVTASFARIIADGFQLLGLIPRTEAARGAWVRRISFAWPFIALALYAFVRAPVAMVLASGVAQAVMLPMLGVAALYFRYRRSHPDLRPGRLWDALLWLSVGGFFVAAGWVLYSTFVG